MNRFVAAESSMFYYYEKREENVSPLLQRHACEGDAKMSLYLLNFSTVQNCDLAEQSISKNYLCQNNEDGT
jgi:hypothetical protein